jgi:hypothetical protein
VLDERFYNLMMEAYGAVGSAMGAVLSRSTDQVEPPPLLQLHAGRAESPGWFLVQAAEFDPRPITVADLRVRDVYASERIVRALLDLMVSEDWLDRDGQERYLLTESGRGILEHRRQRRQAALVELEPVLGDDAPRLAALLRRVIEASLQSPTPPGTWCLAHSRHRAPVATALPLVQIVQYFDDVNAFRDDAHMAAWQPLGVAGYAWEAFALLCRGQATAVEALFAALAHRGYARGEYAAALQELAERGWVEPGLDGAYAPTAAGRAIHAEAEALTDRYFYAPWVCLEGDEVATTQELLTLMCDQLGVLAP